MATIAETGRGSWVAGPAAVALGLAAHIVSGGNAPTVPVLLAFAALSGLAAQLLTRWFHGPLLFLFLSGAAQQLLHFGFDAFGGSFPGVGFLDHLHGAAPVPPNLAAWSAGSTAGSAAVHAGDFMLYTHAAAAILTLLVAAGAAKLARHNSRTHAIAAPQHEP